MLDKGVRVAIYCYVYEHYKLVSLPWDSMLTWAVAALAVDFFYYWAHRAVHGDTYFYLRTYIYLITTKFKILVQYRNWLCLLHRNQHILGLASSPPQC